MRVAELEDLLARLDDDLLVCVRSGHFAGHITEAQKQQRRRWDFPEPPVLAPPQLLLASDTVWYEPEPPWALRGRWPNQAFPRCPDCRLYHPDDHRHDA